MADDDAGRRLDVRRRARSRGANAFAGAAQDEADQLGVGDPTHEAFWIKHPHAPQARLTPLEHYEQARRVTGRKVALALTGAVALAAAPALAGSPRREARKPQKKRSRSSTTTTARRS